MAQSFADRIAALGIPAVGEAMELPGGLQAFGAHLDEPEPCELCEQTVQGPCYGVPIGGGWAFVHVACIGECV